MNENYEETLIEGHDCLNCLHEERSNEFKNCKKCRENGDFSGWEPRDGVD